VTGVSVLAVVLHENTHHTDPHDHHIALRTVIHGHSHEGNHHHDHELVAPLAAARVSFVPTTPGAAFDDAACTDGESNTFRSVITFHPVGRDAGPPSYLLHCVLLT